MTTRPQHFRLPQRGPDFTLETQFAPRRPTSYLCVETLLGCETRCGHKSGIQFDAGGMVTLTLGTREYGQGHATPYLANILVTRLGIPLNRIRVYFSGALPAVRRTPRPEVGTTGLANIGAVADLTTLIERLCDQVIEKASVKAAEAFGVSSGSITFDAANGSFRDGQRRMSVIELAQK